MDASDKIAQALRLARSTGGKLELNRAKEARRRAPGQIAPSKYMPGVPRQVRADGGKIPEKEAKKNLTAWHKDADMSVKNPDGSPKVFYHRTSKSFDTFNVNKEGNSGPALFFGDNPEILPQMHNRKSEGDHIMPVHLNMRSPLLLDEFNLKEMRDRFANGSKEFPHYIHPRIADNLKSLGYDGIVAEDIYGRPSDGNEYIVFHPHQVKSAIGNSGQFDPEDPNITKAEGGEVDDKDLTPHINNPMSIFPKPQRMFPEEARPPGGQYLAMPDKRDVTGHKAAAATIGVQPGGKPFFKASSDAVDSTGSAGRGTATVKTNLFKQRAGWRWSDAPEGHEATDTIVSVEHRGKHHYALNAHFPKGVNLARYENSPSEPRLRPTTTGNVELGPQVGSILVRGKEHPVYRHVIVKASGGFVGA